MFIYHKAGELTTMLCTVLLIACLYSRTGLSEATYSTNWINGLNAGQLQRPNPSTVLNNGANQFVSSHNRAFNSVTNGFNAGVNLPNQVTNNIKAFQNNIRHPFNPIPVAQQAIPQPVSGQQLNNVGGIQDRNRFLQVAQNVANQRLNLQAQNSNIRYPIQNGIQSLQGPLQNQFIVQNALNRAPNPFLNVLQQNSRFINQRLNPQIMYNQKSTALNVPQVTNQPVQQQIPSPPINIMTRLSKNRLNTETNLNAIKEYDFINPLEVLRKSVSNLKLTNDQLKLFNYFYNAIKDSMRRFNEEFIKGYKTGYQGVVNTTNIKNRSGLDQLLINQMIENEKSFLSKMINNIFTTVKSHTVEKIKKAMQLMNISIDDLFGVKEPASDISLLNTSYSSDKTLNDNVNMEYEGKGTNVQTLQPSNSIQIVNRTLLSINSSVTPELNNSAINIPDINNSVLTNSALNNSVLNITTFNHSAFLIDDGSTFKDYLIKINSTQDIISKWDTIMQNKDEDGKLNLTMFAKADPFCSCNDTVSCNCCLTLNMTVINKQVCLEATMPKATNGTKLSIIFDERRQGITHTKGLEEKVQFEFDGLAKGELNILKRQGSTNTTDEFCGVASLDTLGLRYPSLPLGCFSVSNDTIKIIDDHK